VGKIALHLGQFSLPAHAGIDIVRADLTAPSLDKPMHADIEASYAGAPLHLVSDGGSLAQLRPGTAPGAPEPLSLTIEAGGATLSAKGAAALLPFGRGDVDVALSARVPDLAALSALAGRPLPSLRQIVFDGHLSGNLGGALALRKARLTLPQAQVTGDLDVARAPRVSVKGAVQAQRIDLDGLLASLARATKPAAAAASPAPPVAGAAPAKPDKTARLIPDEPFDLAGLSREDIDVQLAIAQLQTGGASYGDITGHLSLQDGRLALDPFSGQTPGGHLDAKLTIDSTVPEPPMSVALHAPSLALQPLAAALGAPEAVAGTAWIDMDLRGAGRSPRALAATLDGHFGLAVADADIDNQALGILLGAVLKTAKFPESVLGGPGQTRLRCLAVRLDASRGVVTVPVLVADATRVVVQGGGGFDLGQETLNVHLRPLLRAGPGIEVPVRVGGTFRDPKVASDQGGGRALASLTSGRGDSCGAALAAVRGPDAPPLPPLAPPGKPPKPIDLLRGLLH
jgi:AsmA protein